MKKKNKRMILAFSWILFIIYLVMMVYFLFFSEQLGRQPSNEYHYNLKPFTEIKRYVRYIGEIGFFNVALNLAGNVVCFMPVGFTLPILSNRKIGIIRIFFVSLFTSAAVELIQLITKLGSCDIDDIIMNTCGGLLGYILFWICNRIYRVGTKKKKRK